MQLVVEQTHCGRRYVYRVQSFPVTSRLPTHTHDFTLYSSSGIGPVGKGEENLRNTQRCVRVAYTVPRGFTDESGEKNLLWSLGDGAEGNKQHSGTLVGKTILLLFRLEFLFLLRRFYSRRWLAGWLALTTSQSHLFLRCACVCVFPWLCHKFLWTFFVSLLIDIRLH